MDREREAKKERKRRRKGLAEKHECGDQKNHRHIRGAERKREHNNTSRIPKSRAVKAVTSDKVKKADEPNDA